jgi:hypothetical protein
VHVDVEAMRADNQEVHVTSADLTFVCVDDQGKPTEVVPIS